MAIRMGKGDGKEGAEELLFHDEGVVVAAPHFNGGQLPRTPSKSLHSPIIYSKNPGSRVPAAGIEMSTERKGLCSNDSNRYWKRSGWAGHRLERRSLGMTPSCAGDW